MIPPEKPKGQIIRYNFADAHHADEAAGHAYKALHAAGYMTVFANIKGHGHQEYCIYKKGQRTMGAAPPLMVFELDMTAEPPFVEYALGTSIDNIIFLSYAEDAARKFGGEINTSKDKPIS